MLRVLKLVQQQPAYIAQMVQKTDDARQRYDHQQHPSPITRNCGIRNRIAAMISALPSTR
jgi:hypothetical protein